MTTNGAAPTPLRRPRRQAPALPALEAHPEGAVRTGVRDRVTEALREALIIGRIQPGRPVTLRGLAEQLGTSPMPVREAIRGLAAERALDVRENGRIAVPRMTEQRLSEILKARALLEPVAAALALPRLDRKAAARRLQVIDDAVDASLKDGDVEAYMRHNHAFHFAIYEASGSDVFLPLIESVWLRFGPFMRMVYGRVGTAGLVDHHKAAVAAIADGNADALSEAIRLDIAEGMDLIRDALVAGAADFADPG
ncbi:GntR family transcriptional regulator [Chthonobacter rhizosphaerae]|uniref:GntR family transcriptional regulator n=1 Tax=Chthonobacter rhizosphaerae TaxID=2735553 RepID=UPI0015EEDFB5|nr:GntR family transcriptional regulator [Chthonobacter rhizosphaerae]